MPFADARCCIQSVPCLLPFLIFLILLLRCSVFTVELFYAKASDVAGLWMYTGRSAFDSELA